MAFFLTLGFVSGYIDTCDFLRHKHLSSSVSAKVAIVIRKGMDKSWVNSGPIGLHGGLSCQKWQASHSSCQTWLLSQVGVTDSMNRFPHVCWSPTSSCHFLPNRLGPSDPPIRFQRADPETAAQQARTRILHIGPYRFMLSQSCSHFGPNKRPVISPRLHPSRWLRREPREPSAPLPWPTWRWNFLKRRNWRSDSRSAKAVHPESLSNHTVILFYMGCLPPAIYIYIYISLYIYI